MVSCLIFKSLSHFEFLFVYAVRECSNVIDLHVAFQLSQHHCWRDCLFSTVYSYLLCWRLIECRCMGLFLGSLLLHWFICLFLCQYHTVLITVAVQCCLKSGRVMPRALFFFLRIALAILVHLWFHINFRIICSSSVKNVMGNLIEITLNLNIALGSMAILTILILPIQEHGISFHFFESS